MNKTLKIGLIFLVVTTLIYIGYLVFLGTALSHLLWQDDPIPVLISIALGLLIMVPLLALFIAAIIQIQRVMKYTAFKLALLIITLVAVPATPLAVARSIDRHHYELTYTFTPAKWREADTRDRSRLIDSFREQYALVGEHIEVVLDLLGEPDLQEETQYMYDLGDFKTWLAIDPYFYIITFDANDIVTSEGIYQG